MALTKTNILKLIVSLALPLSLGAIAGIVTSDAIPDWYTTLNSPSFNPPNWLFGPVWSTLYVLMGISFYWVWSKPASKARNRAIVVFIAQLLLNFCWSFIFFYFHNIELALIEIIVLWISIFIMLRLFYSISPKASFINIPYLLWVTFATLLNASYYILN